MKSFIYLMDHADDPIIIDVAEISVVYKENDGMSKVKLKNDTKWTIKDSVEEIYEAIRSVK